VAERASPTFPQIKTGRIRLVIRSSRDGIHDWALFGARLLFFPLAILTLVSLALELGAWHTEFKIAGPFGAETNPPRASLILEVPRASGLWNQPVGDDAEHPFQSFLELRINGRDMGPPHTPHETIRTGKTTGFSHWGPNVIFSLPPEVKNGPETIVALRYKVRPRRSFTLAVTVLSVLLGWLLYNGVLRSGIKSLAGRYERLLAAALGIPGLILLGICGLGLIGSAVYVASSIYASATGWTLPTTALIRWSPIAEWAARNEPYFGYLLLMLAGFGASASWLTGPTAHHGKLGESNELPLRFIALCSFAVAVSAFILCMSATWAGIVRPDGFFVSNIGGLNPFFDAESYLAAAHDQARDGFWNDVALNRPLAAAFRSALAFFGNFSLPAMLILQACLIAAATCFAAAAVAMWRGIWAGLAFFALTYIYARFFVPEALTESLGLFWALLSVPFFIEAFRSRSVQPALTGFAMTVVALTTRMGSMLTIPALLLWLVWQFGRDARARLRILAVACSILIGIFGLSSLLKNLYGTGQHPSSGNFAYQICGLTMGTIWTGCLTKADSEGKPLAHEPEARMNQLYSMAWENFKANPTVIFDRIVSINKLFFSQFPEVILKGYSLAIPEPNWFWRNTLTAVCLIGLLYAAGRRMTGLELAFWTLVWASIVGSASIIYADDGARTLAASHPLIALFLAIGFSSPATSAPTGALPSSRLSQYGALGLILAAALFVCVPWLAHRFSPAREITDGTLVNKPGEAFVFGGRRMSGFLVIADDQPLRNDVPSVHLASFVVMVAHSNMELYQDLIHPVIPPLPFGFVLAPRLEQGVQSLSHFIVPAEVLERPDVPSWRFQFVRWGYRPNADGFQQLWFYVTRAEPWP
jgi:hypothetical protein